jgi:hypothetical protein
MSELTPRPAPTVHAPKGKPDAGPMRLALGAAGVAALSALAVAIVMPPSPPTATVYVDQPAIPAVDVAATQGPVSVQRPIKYIQLAPGQTPPPGATVIDAAAPTPVTVVVNVPAPAKKATAPKPIYIKTTQSGKVVK